MTYPNRVNRLFGATILLIGWVALGTAGVPLGTHFAPAPAHAQSGYGSPPAPAQEPVASLPDIEHEVMCPVCGTLLEQAGEAPQANDERNFIRDLIAQGESKEEILDALVDEFGEEVLAVPDNEGFDLAAWLVPGLAVALGGVAILVGLRRWRRETSAAPADAGALSEEDAERLDSDLERYDP